MTSVSVTHTTSASASAVWQLATDIPGCPQWLSGVDSVEMLGGPERFGVGTCWNETRTVMGRQGTEQMVVTALDEGRSYTVEADSGGVHYVSVLELTPTSAGTVLRMTFGAEGGGFMARLLGPLGNRIVGRQLRQDLLDLAAAAESSR